MNISLCLDMNIILCEAATVALLVPKAEEIGNRLLFITWSFEPDSLWE